ncbi:hypothetical protein PAPYR_3268 [Paratrimastix pyriformis]|uniref:Uncharacterized protein n=1 Tax=Paratrimastix pyriformis TaxID=342808 RepID=A0ABQ8UTD4_9EUKA|nr:hypothetical protein PAPYR_3268 [Paratrimastix pyriformis]
MSERERRAKVGTKIIDMAPELTCVICKSIPRGSVTFPCNHSLCRWPCYHSLIEQTKESIAQHPELCKEKSIRVHTVSNKAPGGDPGAGDCPPTPSTVASSAFPSSASMGSLADPAAHEGDQQLGPEGDPVAVSGLLLPATPTDTVGLAPSQPPTPTGSRAHLPPLSLIHQASFGVARSTPSPVPLGPPTPRSAAPASSPSTPRGGPGTPRGAAGQPLATPTPSPQAPSPAAPHAAAPSFHAAALAAAAATALASSPLQASPQQPQPQPQAQSQPGTPRGSPAAARGPLLPAPSGLGAPVPLVPVPPQPMRMPHSPAPAPGPALAAAPPTTPSPAPAPAPASAPAVAVAVGVVEAGAMCPAHPSKRLKRYCLTCERLLCSHCAVNSHAAHRVRTVEVAAAMVRGALAEAMGQLESLHRQALASRALWERAHGHLEMSRFAQLAAERADRLRSQMLDRTRAQEEQLGRLRERIDGALAQAAQREALATAIAQCGPRDLLQQRHAFARRAADLATAVRRLVPRGARLQGALAVAWRAAADVGGGEDLAEYLARRWVLHPAHEAPLAGPPAPGDDREEAAEGSEGSLASEEGSEAEEAASIVMVMPGDGSAPAPPQGPEGEGRAHRAEGRSPNKKDKGPALLAALPGSTCDHGRQLPTGAAPAAGAGAGAGAGGDALDAYCPQCGRLCCARCALFGPHRGHPVVPIEEALVAAAVRQPLWAPIPLIALARGLAAGQPVASSAMALAWVGSGELGGLMDRLREANGALEGRRDQVGPAAAALQREAAQARRALGRRFEAALEPLRQAHASALGALEGQVAGRLEGLARRVAALGPALDGLAEALATGAQLGRLLQAARAGPAPGSPEADPGLDGAPQLRFMQAWALARPALLAALAGAAPQDILPPEAPDSHPAPPQAAPTAATPVTLPAPAAGPTEGPVGGLTAAPQSGSGVDGGHDGQTAGVDGGHDAQTAGAPAIAPTGLPTPAPNAERLDLPPWETDATRLGRELEAARAALAEERRQRAQEAAAQGAERAGLQERLEQAHREAAGQRAALEETRARLEALDQANQAAARLAAQQQTATRALEDRMAQTRTQLDATCLELLLMTVTLEAPTFTDIGQTGALVHWTCPLPAGVQQLPSGPDQDPAAPGCPSVGAIGYRVYMSKGRAAAYVVVGRVAPQSGTGSADLCLAVEGLEPGREYRFRVAAVTPTGRRGPFSAVGTMKALPDPTRPQPSPVSPPTRSLRSSPPGPSPTRRDNSPSDRE